MKKQLILLLCLAWALSGCTTYVRIKWNITKTLNLPYTIDKTGTFVSSSVLSSRAIRDAFIESNSPTLFLSYQFENLSINSFNIAGTVDPQSNTATQVNVNAVVNGASPKPLLNSTRLIYLGKNQLLQDVNDIVNGNTGEINNNASYSTTLTAINIVGVQEVQKILSETLNGTQSSGLQVNLTGTVPPGQRLVGTVMLTINATVTLYRCEETTTLFGLESCD